LTGVDVELVLATTALFVDRELEVVITMPPLTDDETGTTLYI
jgi:hypothetical protein